MKRILLVCLFSLLFSAGVYGQSTDTSSSTIAEVTTHISTIDTTSSEETTTHVLTTLAPEPETTTTSTEPVTTTTTTTTTTSTEPITTTTTTTTTSIVTTSVPVTTEAPEPIPKPVKGSWNVTQNNVTCIRAEMAVLFVIPVEKEKMYIALSPNATTEGSDCNLSNTTQQLVLTDDNTVFTLVFEKAAGKAYVKNITLNYTSSEGNDLVYSDDKKFSVNFGHSYQCRSQEDISLANVTIEVMDIHVQAFGGKDDKGFTTAEECEADDKVGDAVPIAVACALAALIIVVLIAYLVGRRRSRQRGYQSV